MAAGPMLLDPTTVTPLTTGALWVRWMSEDSDTVAPAIPALA